MKDDAEMDGIVFVNHNSSTEFSGVLDREAKANPDIVFANIEVSTTTLSPSTLSTQSSLTS